MDASLDTDIVIHLYGSGKEGLFYDLFDQLYMHMYLYDRELRRKSPLVFQRVSEDVERDRIRIISNRDLSGMGLQSLFDEYRREYEYLFDSGECYGVSMARTMGLAAFASDDTARHGPHEALVRELIEGVMPFSFYELLFLKYLSSCLSTEGMHQEFHSVTSQTMGRHPMQFRDRMKRTARRFSERHGTERDYDWVMAY